jgi:Polyketide cyclase / dehydrase and lipid transport
MNEELRMGTITKQIELDVSAEQAWDAVRDFGELHTRLVRGFVTDTKLEGSGRMVTFANGVSQLEPLVTLDEDVRRLVYSAVDSPMGASHYNAAVTVAETAPGASVVSWQIDFLPDEIAPPLDAAMEAGAAAMRQTLSPQS